MDIALARVLIAQSSLEMLSCAAFNCAVKTSPCFVNDVLSSFCFSAISRLANAWQQWGKPKPCWYVIRLYRLKANLDIRGNTDSNMVSEPGGYSIEFYTGRPRIEVQPLILLHTIFDKKKRYPCLYLSLWQIIPFSHTKFRILHPLYCCKCTFFVM